MPQRPLITFEYVIQNVEEDQDVDMVANNVHPGSTNNTTMVSEVNNNHLGLEHHPSNNGLHQIKIVRSNSNVGGGETHRQNYVTNHAHQHLLHHQQQQQKPLCNNFNNQIKNSSNVSTTEIWHHGPR